MVPARRRQPDSNPGPGPGIHHARFNEYRSAQNPMAAAAPGYKRRSGHGSHGRSLRANHAATKCGLRLLGPCRSRRNKKAQEGVPAYAVSDSIFCAVFPWILEALYEAGPRWSFQSLLSTPVAVSSLLRSVAPPHSALGLSPELHGANRKRRLLTKSASSCFYGLAPKKKTRFLIVEFAKDEFEKGPTTTSGRQAARRGELPCVTVIHDLFCHSILGCVFLFGPLRRSAVARQIMGTAVIAACSPPRHRLFFSFPLSFTSESASSIGKRWPRRYSRAQFQPGGDD